ncbi:Gfo/Idh/MocA family protein [Phycisphaerales bacterium AB-hyl4]|uniref:Gfo/Idh/MocA family protein n=1 Tax=Natronomicrosphaera hydrolytica TaxID=3242702 RepID=A0ABV4U1C8_9BACT
MDPVKIGIIGCGNISNQYLELARQFPILDIAACADLNLDAARAQAEKYNVPQACTVEQLLADDRIELVINLTIPAAHASVALKTIEARKHVYNEKPLAVTVDEANQMLAAAEQKQVRIGCAPDTFLGTAHQACRKAIDEGVIGRPVAATAFMLCRGHETWHPSPAFYYKVGGGPMFDMGPYYLTALINLLGPIARVTGSAGIQIDPRTITSQPLNGQTIDVETPDHVAGTIEFAQGAIGTIITSFAAAHSPHDRRHPITIFGTEGTMQVPDPNNFDGSVLVCGVADKEWREVTVEHDHPNGRSLGVADMAHAIRDRRPHRASGEIAFAVLAAMQGFLTAADTGQAQTLDTSYDRPAMLGLGLSDGVLTEPASAAK